MAISCYKDLLVWQRAMDLVVECYKATECFPSAEKYSLTTQLQRAAVSIPANIAEGSGRGHTKEYIHHLLMARGSLYELETHLLLAQRLNYLDSETVNPLCNMTSDIGRMLNGLINALNRKLQDST